jgi:heme/copper-type cytochrome/quinol oxidase subunit 1
MGAVFGIFTGVSIYWPMLSKLIYKRNMIQAFFNIFFLGVNLTFFPMHFIGLQGCPRKYKTVADKYMFWTTVRTFGATISTFSIWFFITIFNETMIRYRLISSINIVSSDVRFSIDSTAHTYVNGCTITSS